MPREKWKRLYGYEVSTLGRIRYLSGEPVESHPRGNNYLGVILNGKGHYVHRLVMRAFVGHPHGRDVNHKNMDKRDNQLSNLEYLERKDRWLIKRWNWLGSTEIN
jgi:hypothetical protein